MARVTGLVNLQTLTSQRSRSKGMPVVNISSQWVIMTMMEQMNLLSQMDMELFKILSYGLAKTI